MDKVKLMAYPKDKKSFFELYNKFPFGKSTLYEIEDRMLVISSIVGIPEPSKIDIEWNETKEIVKGKFIFNYEYEETFVEPVFYLYFDEKLNAEDFKSWTIAAMGYRAGIVTKKITRGI